jgi:hypothetical protein
MGDVYPYTEKVVPIQGTDIGRFPIDLELPMATALIWVGNFGAVLAATMLITALFSNLGSSQERG